MRPRCVGTSPGPGTAELLWQKPRMANAVRIQGDHVEFGREMAHIPSMRTCTLFSSLHYCILSFRALFSCACRLEAFIKKPVGMWREAGLCVAPALVQDSGMCSREKESSLCSQNGKGIHLAIQTGIYSLPCCSDNKLKAFLSCAHSQLLTSV